MLANRDCTTPPLPSPPVLGPVPTESCPGTALQLSDADADAATASYPGDRNRGWMIPGNALEGHLGGAGCGAERDCGSVQVVYSYQSPRPDGVANAQLGGLWSSNRVPPNHDPTDRFGGSVAECAARCLAFIGKQGELCAFATVDDAKTSFNDGVYNGETFNSAAGAPADVCRLFSCTPPGWVAGPAVAAGPPVCSDKAWRTDHPAPWQAAYVGAPVVVYNPCVAVPLDAAAAECARGGAELQPGSSPRSCVCPSGSTSDCAGIGCKEGKFQDGGAVHYWIAGRCGQGEGGGCSCGPGASVQSRWTPPPPLHARTDAQ